RTVPTFEQRIAGDINGDGWIDSADANMIIHHVLNDKWPSVPSENTRRAKRDAKNTPILISLDDVEGISGSEVTTTLSINNLVDLASLNLAILYDPNVVEKVVKVERTGLAANSSMMFYDAGDGRVRINMDTQTPIHGSGAFATITLQLKDEGHIRSMPLSIAHANLYDIAGRDFVISALQRKVEAHHAKATVTDVEEVPLLKDDAVVTPIEDLFSNTPPISESVYSASGTILDQNGQPVDGVTVQVADKTVITDETGQWKITELPKGQHEVSAFKAGYTFDSQAFTVEDEDVVIAFSDKSTPPAKEYLASGQILDEFGKPIPGVTIQIGEKTVVTDASGEWAITDLPEGEYQVIATKDNYTFPVKACAVGNDENCTVKLKPGSVLNVKVVPNSWKPAQGENVTYTITVTNQGDEIATAVKLTDILPEGTSLVSMAALEGGECDADTVTCSLPDLPPGATATAKLVINNAQAKALVNKATVTANEYPDDVQITW
ncbi:MAG: carboxypeptidase regulatory-like domain-containing protein, partial [Candidatus Parabeggiatoa sp.]|nr:carboxypeptidase regulatory-like domain-containing protein [Candidatus Parabeggiatoa sp.]